MVLFSIQVTCATYFRCCCCRKSASYAFSVIWQSPSWICSVSSECSKWDGFCQDPHVSLTQNLYSPLTLESGSIQQTVEMFLDGFGAMHDSHMKGSIWPDYVRTTWVFRLIFWICISLRCCAKLSLAELILYSISNTKFVTSDPYTEVFEMFSIY